MAAKAPAGEVTTVPSTIVAERVPLKLLKMETVEEYFSRFGALAHIEIDRARHQAVIDFEESMDAQAAVSCKEPILGEPTVYLRFFRGARPHPYAPRQQPPAPPPAPVPSQPPSATATFPSMGQPDNMVMESCDASKRRQEREDSQQKKKELMQKITDKMKTVMVRLTDTNLREEQRDQLQELLMTLKKQLTSLTTPVAPGQLQGPPGAGAGTLGVNGAVNGAVTGPPGMGSTNNASAPLARPNGGVPGGGAPNNVLDLRSKVLRIEFKSSDESGKDKDEGTGGGGGATSEKEREKELKAQEPTAALKKICSEIEWSAPELTVAWDDSQAEDGKPAIIVTFADRRTAEHALGDLPRNLVSASFLNI